jgi:hypothetical protein
MGAIESTKLLNPWSGKPMDWDPFDHSKDDARLPLETLRQWELDLINETPWRTEADKAHEYYDGNQITPERMNILKSLDMDAVTRNMSAVTVNALLGMEEKSRQDWKVTTDYEDQQELADAGSVKMAEAERMSHADIAISEAYASQVKGGFGCVEVSQESNPFKYKHRVSSVHRRELRWDPRSKKLDWSDARFIRRDRWFDADILAAYFPAQREIINYSMGSIRLDHDFTESETLTLERAMDSERGWGIMDLEWRDMHRKRARLSELWYRVFHRGQVFTMPNGKVVEFDENNMHHVLAVESGMVQLQEAVYDKLRCAYMLGPHRLMDYDTELRDFPYVPFWGYREDLTGAPYGIMRSLMPIQDEINLRLQKMLYLLKSQQTIVDDDAVSGEAAKYNSMADLQREVANQRSFIVLNAKRLNADAIKVNQNFALADAQYRAMMDAINAVPQVSGVYAAMLGQNTNTTAASAISQLIDQGATTQAELNGNYIWGRRKVGELLFGQVRKDMIGHPMDVVVDVGHAKRRVQINVPAIDEQTGLQIIKNNMATADVKVQLSDVPSTSSFKQQQFLRLTEYAKSLSPQAQALLTPLIIESTDIPERHEIAKQLREQMGIALDPKSPEAQQQKMAQAEAMAKQAKMLEDDMLAKIDEQRARAEKIRAEAGKIAADAQKTGDDATTQRINDLEQSYQAEIQKLKDKMLMDAANASVERYRIQSEVEARESEAIEATRREEIKADAAKEVALVNARTKEAQDAANNRMTQLADELDERLKDISTTTKELVSQVQDNIMGKVDEARKESDARHEAKESKPEEPKESHPIHINVQVEAAKPVSKTITIKRGGETIEGVITPGGME